MTSHVPKICVAYASPGTVSTCFTRSLLSLLNARNSGLLKAEIRIVDVEGGPLIGKMRNILAEEFLKFHPPMTHLLMCDTDMEFTYEDVNALLAAKRAVVGGIYIGRLPQVGDLHSVAMKKHEDGVYRPIPMEKLPGPGEIIAVDALGMGLTLIERKVIEKLKPDHVQLWPFAETVIEGRGVGEDISFCYRAKEAGFNIWLSGDARAGHAKTQMLWA